MKKLLAIVLTVALIVAFAATLSACNPVEKTESFNATVEDVQALRTDSTGAYSHYEVTTTTAGVTSNLVVYLINYAAIGDGMSAGYSIYVTETPYSADGTAYKTRHRLAAGDGQTAVYGEAIVQNDGTSLFSYAVDKANYDIFGNDYKAAYELNSFPTGNSVLGEYKSAISVSESTLTNALASGVCKVTAERYIKGKEVTQKVYTVTFDLEDGSAKDKGTVVIRTDDNGTVNEISVTWEDGDSVSTKYIHDGSGTYGYDWLNEFDGYSTTSKFFDICGVPKNDLTA